MTAETKPVRPPRSWKRAVRRAALALSLVLVLGAAVLWVVLSSGNRGGRDMAGLGGTWRDTTSPKHTYRLRPDGKVDGWYEGLPYGVIGTWDRDGQNVVVHTDRNWDLEGTLEDGTIRGRLVERPSGNPLGPTVWKRE
jgi:hypothetical protein